MRAGPSHDTPTSVKLGFGFFAIGLVFLAVTVLPFFFGEHNRSLWLNLGCLLAPLGFIMTISGSVRAGRDRQRTALSAVSDLAGDKGAAETAPDSAPWHTDSSV